VCKFVGFRNFFIAHLPKFYQSKNETKKIRWVTLILKKIADENGKKIVFFGVYSFQFLKNSFNIQITRI
jgi:hypothetical protein